MSAPAALPGDRQVSLDWSASDFGPGAAITDYVVQQSTNCCAWSTIRDGKSTATSYTVGRLVNGSGYRFRIAPLRGAAQGPWTTSAAATPRSAPSAPSGLKVTTGVRSVTLTWAAPFDGGSTITDYVVQYSTDRKTWITITDGVSTATTATVTGLTPRVTYRFRVAAVNVVGTGSFSGIVSGVPSGP